MKTQPDISDDFDTSDETPVTPAVRSNAPAAPSKLPVGLKESIARLHAIEAMPESTRILARQKAIDLAQIRDHIFKLQQGLPVVEIPAGHIAEASRRSAPEARRARLDTLAKSHPELREFLEEFDALKAKRK